jgi:hypothetical protein
MNLIEFFLILVLAAQLSGCVFTKVVTVPMRVGGGIISVVPIVGNPVDEVIDKGADAVDLLPF